MKGIYKIFIALVILFAVATKVSAAVSYEPFEEIQMENLGVTLAMVAPVAAIGVFNPDQLKIPLERFNELKAKHGRLYVVNVSIDEDERYQFIVCRPTRNLLSALANYKDDMDKANELIIKNMVLDGDLEALDDGVVYAKLMEQVATIMSQGTAFLQKA